jgi:hypothetical protein
LKSGQNSPDREDYVLAKRGNYAQIAKGKIRNNTNKNL